MAAVMVALCCHDMHGLYGSFVGLDNPGEHQHVDLRRLGAQQGPRAGVRVAPEVRTSSIRTTRRPWNVSAAVGGDLECALHIAGALGPRQADLLLGRAGPAAAPRPPP